MPLASCHVALGLILSLSLCVNAKDVFAHFMVQNSYSYTKGDWAKDINAAKDIGIDGFVLNTAVDSYERLKYPDAFSAADAASFKLFISFDMSYSWQTADMVKLVKDYASRPSYYKWKGEPLVSTFAGDENSNDFWATLKKDLKAAGVSISLAPAFITFREPDQASQLFSKFTAIDGFFNWWSWPADEDAELTTDTDKAYKNALSQAHRSGPFIMSVSPWQFKNLAKGQNWVEQSDTLWIYRWHQAIEEVKPDIVEIVSWNDYAESHYISDINPKVKLGALATKYVNGFTHAGWRIMAKWYISWFKQGTAPDITEDKVIFWYRGYSKTATCQGRQPKNWKYPKDELFAFSMLKSDADVTLTVGKSTKTFHAAKGIASGSVPFSKEDGQRPVVEIKRNGKAVKKGTGSKAINTKQCSDRRWNYNPLVQVVQ
ncbi:glycoside hydrolase family 71 protein [Lentinula raphanica]|uniref:Glycoside hydrolase family 71 protein n=1 Tax=Lentinula raphanica TaxID=153919 RepID=A0AA38UKI9_9AGAR|nr:glycoside hydrolase family 71 protein [Lentinula raphanica]